MDAPKRRLITIENHVREKAILAGLSADSLPRGERSTQASMDELEALLETAGGESCGCVLQSRYAPNPRSFFGTGKIDEMKTIIENEGCTLAVIDNELSPSQARALSADLGVRVIDRSGLIMDIFAQRARTREGRLQVELAQYKYLLPRLTGMWGHLASQTGTSSPIGTRGPGETQLETDRRHIRQRIIKLEQDLDAVRKNRSTQRRLRRKNAVPIVALVGYTNAGKSSLLNALTGAEIQAEDRLFDTLDTTTRSLKLPDVGDVLFSDTVGFIRKLPHHLVEAFKATLEELSYADLLLHVIDASNPDWEMQAQVVESLIQELGADKTPRLDVFNKSDVYTGDIIPHGRGIVSVSAKTGAGLDNLIAEISRILGADRRRVVLRIPYDKAGLVEQLHRDADVINESYLDNFIEITAVLSRKTYGRLKDFID